ncbi:MAG: DUF4249 domain-containing protein [Bacteroidia bacterium]|nr:DUF4249 domain-containing protein [Bacteroidia bacterium]
MMSRIKIKINIICLILIIGISCEKELNNVTLPDFVSKLVVTSFISPSDSISYIAVEANQRIYGDLSIRNSTGNLTGYISDSVTEIRLDTANGKFFINPERMKIDYGRSYSLKIQSDIGLIAKSKCYVPVRQEYDLRVDTFSIYHEEPGYNAWREFKAKVTFTDPAETEIYYRIIGTFVTYTTYPHSNKPYIHSEYIWFDEDYLTDALKDTDGNIMNVGDFNNTSWSSDSAFLKITLLNTEKSYYQYHKSLDNYNDSENPFSEPTLLYSNIEGGLGIFTSYTSEVVIMRLK